MKTGGNEITWEAGREIQGRDDGAWSTGTLVEMKWSRDIQKLIDIY